MPAAEYTPRDPSASVLYTIVRDHVETFRTEAARMRDNGRLPRFVDDEFRAFLRCGFLAGGFARFRCEACRAERLVPFSCKGRGFCPSCGGRRMAERAAHLVDHVFPDVPVRQWVLTVPPRVRYLLAWRHDLCRAVARILHQTIERHLRGWADSQGVGDARGGGVAIIQRFGGAVNLNPHLHALIVDGVFARTAGGLLRFHAAPAPTPIDMADILATIVPHVRRLLARQGLDDDTATDPVAADAPLLAHCASASVEGLEIDGAARQRPRRLGVRVPAGHRDRLEAVCRYALRPPLAEERLTRTTTGDVAVELRRPWADGTTHLVFAPTAFLARLAVLVPRPRVNLLLYQGVLAPRAAWRSEVVPRSGDAVPLHGVPASAMAAVGRGWRWADLMRRVFAIDVLTCPRCGGRLRFVATLEASETTRRILRHLHLPIEVPAPAPPRAPPSADDWAA